MKGRVENTKSHLHWKLKELKSIAADWKAVAEARRKKLRNSRAEGVPVARPPHQAGGGGSIPTSALDLVLESIPFPVALELNQKWHSRLPNLRTGFIRNMPYPCWAARWGDRWWAVAIWSTPVARNLPQDWSWLELRRLAVAPNAPRNTPSRMLSVMARLIRKSRPEVRRLVSYHDTEVHTGGIYRAAGWVPVRTSAGDTWHGRKGREGRVTVTAAPKVRWEKELQ